jgi:negative regulator of sigma E activity
MSDEPRGHDRLPEDLLSAYVDGEVTDAERAAVEARVARDVAWQHILADVVTARDAVRGLPEREPPTGFWLRVLTRVAEVAEQDRATIAAAAAVVPIARPAPRRVPRWGAIGAAVVAVVAGVALAMPQRNHQVSPKIATLTNQHAAASSAGSDPITNLAPAAVPVGLTP